MEYDNVYKQLPQSLGTTGAVLVAAATPYGSGTGAAAQALATNLGTSMKEFVCPSNGNQKYSNPTNVPPLGAFTNYKAMGASCAASLAMCANSSGTVPYGTATIHPDGAVYPGTGCRIADILDGTAHTIIIIETIDDSASRWMLGSECTLTGLPPNSVPTGTTPNTTYGYFVPGNNTYQPGVWGDSSPITAAGLLTFLMVDFGPGGMYETNSTAHAYGSTSSKVFGSGQPQWTATDPPPSGMTETPYYGPSSSHPSVVTVGMGDGSTQALNKRADAANVFFLITKNNNDPFYIP
jgi:hypothetical protein